MMSADILTIRHYELQMQVVTLVNWRLLVEEYQHVDGDDVDDDEEDEQSLILGEPRQ